MLYYAIRQKSTGFYLSGNNKKRGFTWEEPCDPLVRPPRLFITTYAARNALRWWLEGKTHVSYHGEDGEDWHTDKVETRNPEDMEIVRIELLIKV